MLLGVSITLIDNNGVFRIHDGSPLLGQARQSHRTNRVCDLGFSPACPAHCRHEMNERGQREGRPFVHTCWKGVREVAVPLVWQGAHVGTLFAGVFREEDPVRDKRRPRAMLSDETRREIQTLPTLPPERAEPLGRVLEAFAHGLLQRIDTLLAPGRAPHGREAAIRRFLNYNLGRPVRIDDLAEALHLSASRTSHVLRERFGKSFGTLLREERMRAARTLLLSTDAPLTEIARRVGMRDPYHFNRTFRNVMGEPPGRFRRRHLPGSS